MFIGVHPRLKFFHASAIQCFSARNKSSTRRAFCGLHCSAPWPSSGSLPSLEPLLLPARDFLDALGHGQILRHRAAQFVNGLADFAAHFVVNPVGVILVPHVFAPQLFLGLRGAEKIGRQFRAAHVIENMLLRLEPLALMEAHS